MSTDFLKKYIDIINEAEQPRVQLDEDSPYSKKQINWVIKYNQHDKFKGKGAVFNVDSTARKVRWKQPLRLDVIEFEKVGLDIWDRKLRQAVTNAVLAQMPPAPRYDN